MATIPEKDETTFMTVREMVVEIRKDVKDVVQRVSALEGARFQLQGAWAAFCVAGAVIAGVSGLVLGAVALL